jgi:hypothetical protein
MAGDVIEQHLTLHHVRHGVIWVNDECKQTEHAIRNDGTVSHASPHTSDIHNFLSAIIDSQYDDLVKRRFIRQSTQKPGVSFRPRKKKSNFLVNNRYYGYNSILLIKLVAHSCMKN